MERRAGSEGPKQQDPMQKALTRFERQVASPTYKGDVLKRALEGVRKAGTKAGTSPGELYAKLADLSGRAADVAAEHGQESDQIAFTEQKSEFAQTSEQLAEPKGKKKSKKSSGSSKPGRKSGVAAG